ncbi:phenylalanine-4-hydroxylase [uncultured Cyclobacterium sp.]|uniref:phenylalanine-4-hydroxylase n=1 Tax=uncultured Cyclobacterium sp. TaxID=453820 RepID=UPI0030EDE034|tara:strand:- start:58835 stop:59638 length:804 start_codon:yes stop_codon:yes gene_type:complete
MANLFEQLKRKNIFSTGIFSDPSLALLQQDFKTYTPEDYKVWEILFEKQEKNLPGAAAKEVISGMEAIGFTSKSIADLKDASYRLKVSTGWSIQVVPGLLSDASFYNLLQNKRFPVTSWLRKLDELDYQLEPDLFHDAFAHLPLLMNPTFTRFLEDLATLALRFIDNPLAIELISRIYWYTVEFGLLRENNGIKVYGASILSSSGELNYCLSETSLHHDFEVEAVLNTPYWKNKFQDRYFIINDFEELCKAIPLIEEQLEELLQKAG